MGKDRLMCMQCGNTDMRKMTFTNSCSYLQCNICHAATPLYDEFVYVDDGTSRRVQNLLSLAQQLVDRGDYEQAAPKYREVITMASDNHAAWWGCYVCEKAFAEYYGYADRYGNGGRNVILSNFNKLLSDYANVAIANAPDDVAEVYKARVAEDYAELTRRLPEGTKQASGCLSGLLSLR